MDEIRRNLHYDYNKIIQQQHFYKTFNTANVNNKSSVEHLEKLCELIGKTKIIIRSKIFGNYEIEILRNALATFITSKTYFKSQVVSGKPNVPDPTVDYMSFMRNLPYFASNYQNPWNSANMMNYRFLPSFPINPFFLPGPIAPPVESNFNMGMNLSNQSNLNHPTYQDYLSPLNNNQNVPTLNATTSVSNIQKSPPTSSDSDWDGTSYLAAPKMPSSIGVHSTPCVDLNTSSTSTVRLSNDDKHHFSNLKTVPMPSPYYENEVIMKWPSPIKLNAAPITAPINNVGPQAAPSILMTEKVSNVGVGRDIQAKIPLQHDKDASKKLPCNSNPPHRKFKEIKFGKEKPQKRASEKFDQNNNSNKKLKAVEKHSTKVSSSMNESSKQDPPMKLYASENPSVIKIMKKFIGDNANLSI